MLGFYQLMERTRGAAVGPWMKQYPDTDEGILLHPAVVQAVAIVPLNHEGPLPEGLFSTSLESTARDYAD